MSIINRQSSGFGSSSSNPNSRDFMTGLYQDAKDALYEEYKALNHDFATKVINSQAYKDAYALFVNLTDQRWLQRLVAIPHSVTDPGITILDQLGLSSSYDDKVAANYQYCMTEIAKLVEQYQSYVQGLPESQANQLSVIGANSAITGAQLSGSQIEPMQHGAPQAMQSSDATSFITGAASFLLSATNGFADLALKFNDLGLREIKQSFDITKETTQFFEDLNKYARDNGISFSHPLRSFDDLNDSLKITDSGKDVIQLKQFFNDAIDWEHYAPLVYKSIHEQRGNAFLSNYLHAISELNGDISYGLGDLTVNPVGINGVVDAQYNLYMLEKGNAIMRKKYETELLKHGSDSAEYKATNDLYNRDIAEYQRRRNEITNCLINALHNSSHPDDKLLLSKILLNYNYNDLEIQATQADWSDWNAFFGGVGNAAGAAASIVPLL